MQTEEHWEMCKKLKSYVSAQIMAFQLRAVASDEGLDPNGIHVLSKKEVKQIGNVADAQVFWEDGPVDWALKTDLHNIDGVCIEVHGSYAMSFYDI